MTSCRNRASIEQPSYCVCMHFNYRTIDYNKINSLIFQQFGRIETTMPDFPEILHLDLAQNYTFDIHMTLNMGGRSSLCVLYMYIYVSHYCR